jgi:hypothetical protein
MKNKDPLLVAEPREMLAAGGSRALRDFCQSVSSVALSALSPTHSVGQACASSRSSETPCQIVLTRADYLFDPLDRDWDQHGNPIAGRVAP